MGSKLRNHYGKIIFILLIQQPGLLSSCQTFNDFKYTFGPPAGIQFAVVGDIMVHEPQLHTSWYDDCNCHNFEPVFSEVKPYLESADLTIGNLETTLPGDPGLYSGYPKFGAPDSLADALVYSGFDILTTANNHSCDKGKDAIIRTTEVLDDLNLFHLGTYKSRREYEKNRIFLIRKNGLKFAMLNYTYGTNGITVPDGVHVNLIDKDVVRSDIELARTLKTDGIIVLFHFGTEYLRFPDDFQKEMVDFAFYEGADIVLGGHPHVLQPFEVKRTTDRYGAEKDRLVIYSLGNFVSNQRARYKNGGIIFRFFVNKNSDGELFFRDVNFVPVWVSVSGDSGGRLRHRILPVEDYIDPAKAPFELSDEERQMMTTFYNDTMEHLTPSMEEAAGKNKSTVLR